MGPFESAEERDSQWDTWLAGATDAAIAPLLSILREPPVMRPDMWSEMELKMEKDALRKPFITLLGVVHSVPALGWLSARGQLLPGELALAAGFLAQAGGPEARQVLLQVLPGATSSPEALAACERALVNLREHPSSPQLEIALARSAEALGRMDRGAYRREVAALLAEPRSRRAWVTLLDGVQSAEGLAWLSEPLVRAAAEDGDWSQWLRALGAVGGAEARGAIAGFRSSGRTHSLAVQRELEEAWKNRQATDEMDDVYGAQGAYSLKIAATRIRTAACSTCSALRRSSRFAMRGGSS